MPQSLPHQALDVVVRLGRSKRRTKRVVSRTSSEEVAEATCSRTNSEIRVLDGNFAERCHGHARDDQPKRPDKKRVMLRFGGGRRSFSSRRHQFTLWKGQAASNVVKTLRGCYALARQELTAWRSRSKTASAEEPASETKASPRHRVFNLPKSPDLKRPRNNSRTSAASSTSIVSSLSSTTEAEKEQHKELYRSELSFCVRRSSSLEMKPSLSGFAETTSGSHERLLLVNALPLNDEDDEDNSLTSRHLPFRSTRINSRMRVLHNEWV
ncbi:hypothetical protein PI124_g20656 [Phytophthora idaei]|nr:hypothetical protein PI125_g21835 [Phytophthora idaei]KAG3131106.1 hypothetical protein PI126_g20210 [Phytophthora idaei]KAG3234289.1 hypothetical protein PI124_g20656 [Phytophthora idaei]